jgi:hypothetical protein
MSINQHTSPAWRRRITAAALLVAANALVAGATILAAAPANAISEKQIQSECADAGGQYSSEKSGDTTFSTCTYFDEEDHAHTDYYADGDYYYSDAPPPPSSKPGPPRLAPNPVLSPVAPSATPKPPGINIGSLAPTKLPVWPTR